MMNEIIFTKMNTVIVDDIEYFKHPPPASIVKAMKRKWAEQLVHKGAVRLRPLSYYREVESSEIGDENEGHGQWRLNGNPMSLGSINEVYVWCGALANTDRNTLLELDLSYDVVVEITDVAEFTKRITKVARSAGYQLVPHVGQVNYDRGRDVTKQKLNALPWQSNVFQKGAEYQHQKEFRLAFTESSLGGRRGGYIDLSLGSCSDIIKIEAT